MALPKIRKVISSSSPAQQKIRVGTRCDLVESKDGKFVVLGVQEAELILGLAGKKKASKLLKSAQRLEFIKKALFGAGILDFLRR